MPVLNFLRDTASASASNSTSPAIQVICAWPVSGQYGPGSRILYYILVAACVFARKLEWLRNAVLAAALLLPAVAALHGIVLAAVHNDDAVDMDIFGAFQLCSIGILAAPVTVRLSATYFNAKGRNIIFLWTVLILGGLLSLTVEFLRIKTTPCSQDDNGNPIPKNPSGFPWEEATCGLVCNTTAGPFSSMREGAQDNIYVIPAPNRLTFGTATLLSAGCCIPAILYLIFMWNKILEINWKSKWGNRSEEEESEPIEGTNGATVGKMKGVNSVISMFLSAVEIPVFGAAVLTILIIGERNFFSDQVNYQTEPIRSVGQWAPIVGSGLAVIGALYVLLAEEVAEEEEEEKQNGSLHGSHCSVHEVERASPDSMSTRAPSAIEMRPSNEIVPTTTHRSAATALVDAGGRRKFAKVLTRIGNYVGTAAQKRFDDSEFKHGKAVDFPEIPGEQHRNSALPQIREQFNPDRDEDGRVTPLNRPRSRASSFNSRMDVDALSEIRAMSQVRKATLEVPGKSTHHRNHSSPTVIISSEDDTDIPQSPQSPRSPHSPQSPLPLLLIDVNV